MGRAKHEWMEAEERGWKDPKDKFVCPDCVEDDYLKDIIRQNASKRQCDYCGKRTRSYSSAPLSCLMEPIASTVHYYFSEPTQAGVPWAEGSFIVGSSDTCDALMGIGLVCKDQLFEDIADCFINDSWVAAAGGHWSSSHPHEDYLDSWGRFVQIVKHEVRYFIQGVSSDAADEYEPGRYDPQYLLPAIGGFVEELGLIQPLPRDSQLFRARERQGNETWELNQEQISAPPSHLARAGRMNPAGISYLYLAFEKQTALAEILTGPPCRAAVARFMAENDLLVLDLTSIPDLPSIFDDNRRWERERLIFLHEFAKEISTPVRKNGQEHVEYVPSQVVSEYFSQVFRTMGRVALDGITYPSAVRPGGRNLVVFPRKEGRIGGKFNRIRLQDCDVVEMRNWAEFTVVIS